MGRLDDAVKAYRAAQAGIETAKIRAERLVEQARTAAEQAKRDLDAAIVAEALEGTMQKDIVRVTGLARETVRTILRRGGIEAE